MVVHSKRHKVERRKQRQPLRRAPTPKAHKLAQPPAEAEEIASSPSDEREPRPEELAKEEETIRADEVEEAAAAAESETDEHLAPRERERSSYDGDTAIKLYLREIGQVKLLTPQ